MLGSCLQLSTRHLTIGAASRPHRLHARLPTEEEELYKMVTSTAHLGILKPGSGVWDRFNLVRKRSSRAAGLLAEPAMAFEYSHQNAVRMTEVLALIAKLIGPFCAVEEIVA